MSFTLHLVSSKNVDIGSGSSCVFPSLSGRRGSGSPLRVHADTQVGWYLILARPRGSDTYPPTGRRCRVRQRFDFGCRVRLAFAGMQPETERKRQDGPDRLVEERGWMMTMRQVHRGVCQSPLDWRSPTGRTRPQMLDQLARIASIHQWSAECSELAT